MQNQGVEVGREFLAGGGSMGERIRAFPWAGTSLGELVDPDQLAELIAGRA